MFFKSLMSGNLTGMKAIFKTLFSEQLKLVRDITGFE